MFLYDDSSQQFLKICQKWHHLSASQNGITWVLKSNWVKIFKPIFSCSHLIARNLMPFCVFPIEMYFHSKLHVCNIRLGTLRYSPLIIIRTWLAVSKFIFKNNTMYRYTVTNEFQPNFAITWQFMESYFIFIEMPLKEIHVHCS